LDLDGVLKLLLTLLKDVVGSLESQLYQLFKSVTLCCRL
jgi:hypothetical protein